MTDQLHLLPKHRDILQDLLRQHLPDVEVWAYGSRTNGQSHDGSDLDLVLRGPALKEISADQLGAFDDAVEESNIPFLVDARDWARLPKRFQREIERRYVVVAPKNDSDIEPEKLFDSLPAGWQQTTLGRAVEQGGGQIQTGPFGSQLHASDYVPVGIPSIMPQNIGDNWINPEGIARITPEDANRLKRYSVQQGDIVYSRRGDVERRALIRANEDGWLCGTGCLRVRFGSNGVDPKYASYFLGHPRVREWIVRHAHGATMQNLNTSILSSCPFVIPPKKEQRAIAHILGTLDDKIELNRRMSETLEAKARALFKSWFVDFDPVWVEMMSDRPCTSKQSVGLVPSKSGRIPDGWKDGVLNEMVELLTGGTPKTSVPHYWGRDIPWYTAKDAPSTHEVFVLETERSITKTGVEESSAKILPAKTTVITARGSVGRLACLGRPMSINQTCYGIRGAGGYPDYFTYFNLKRAVGELKRRTHGTIFDTITRRTFESVDVVLPPVAMAERFETTVTPLMARILVNMKESNNLATVRDMLLTMLISGELRVGDVEAYL